jgi:hypothetical protein
MIILFYSVFPFEISVMFKNFINESEIELRNKIFNLLILIFVFIWVLYFLVGYKLLLYSMIQWSIKCHSGHRSISENLYYVLLCSE